MEYAIGHLFNRGGFGYLKKNSMAFNNMAKACPVLLLTDLDRRPCPPDLLDEWLKGRKHQDFLLRVAVREVEAWLLATDEALQRFLRVRREFRFSDPESLDDPKRELLKLAECSSNREVRSALVRRDRSGTLRQGPAYNSTLIDFVRKVWQPSDASKRCRSLERATNALAELESNWKTRE